MRCGACGRPPQSEITAGKESLLPREIVDQGCYQEFQAEYARLKALGQSDKEAADQALELAKRNHAARERTDFEAKILLRIQRNAQGLHAETGAALPSSMTVGSEVITKAQVMADAQARLDSLTKLNDKNAKSPAEDFKDALGL